MNLRAIASTIGIVAALAACGGGGGSGAQPPAMNAPTPSTTPAVTSASGTVVDDASGSPLAGVHVVLMPWAPCAATPSPATSITPENDGCPTPLPSPQVTTATNGAFTLNGVPNGHYLLIIGADSTSTSGTVQATVHDNVTLTGGNQTLVAPTLPAVTGVSVPMWESNGDYRVASLNATTEVPCFQAWQSERATSNLAAGTVDEWSLENVRSDNAFALTGAAGPVPVLTSGGQGITGGTSCNSLVSAAFIGSSASAVATDPRAEWFAGQYVPYISGSVSATGFAEFPIDPRSYTDPNHPNWP